MTHTTPLEVRFWRFVEKADGCWLWTGSTTTHGYGQISRGRRPSRPIRAHRLSWEIHTGQTLTPDEKVCHTCDNPPCVNPAHLFVGTQADNVRDMVAKGRRGGPASPDACPQSHPYTGDNLYVAPSGARGCKTCRREATRQWRSRRSGVA